MSSSMILVAIHHLVHEHISLIFLDPKASLTAVTVVLLVDEMLLLSVH